MAKKTDINVSKMVDLAKMDVLAKLRLVVIAIFILITLAIILFFVNQWVIGAAIGLIGYLIVLVLMVKLLLSKKL
jgi:hypothetical protein